MCPWDPVRADTSPASFFEPPREASSQASPLPRLRLHEYARHGRTGWREVDRRDSLATALLPQLRPQVPERAATAGRGRLHRRGRGFSDGGVRVSSQQTLNKRGLTWERYDNLLAQQYESCAICGASGVPLDIDHSYHCCPSSALYVTDCGLCVRGLLCRRCNVLVGYIENSGPELVDRVIRWILGANSTQETPPLHAVAAWESWKVLSANDTFADETSV